MNDHAGHMLLLHNRTGRRIPFLPSTGAVFVHANPFSTYIHLPNILQQQKTFPDGPPLTG